MREGVYGIVTMLFFDACTLEGKSFRVFYFYQKERFFLMTQASKRTHHLAVAAMLSAVAAVLQFVEFSIPLIPSFVKLDI